MKKVQIILAIAMVFAFSANAQRGGGHDQMFKQHLIDSLHFTPVQADSTVAVERDFQMQRHQLATDSTNKADKRAQVKALEDAKNARLAKFLSADQIAQLNEAEKNMRRRPMQMRPVPPPPPPAPGGN